MPCGRGIVGNRVRGVLVVPSRSSRIGSWAAGGSVCIISRTRAWRRPTAWRSGIPGVAMICSGTPSISWTPPPW